MTTQIQREPRTAAFGLAVFAGIMMATAGTFQVIRGLVGLFSNNVLVTTQHYIFTFNMTAWGWIHLILGLALIVIGMLVVAGKTVGRVLGIVVVAISAISNFMSLPHYPVWSFIAIGIEVLVIWALCVYSAEPEIY